MQVATKPTLLLLLNLLLCAAAGRNHRQVTRAALEASAGRTREASAYISDLESRGVSERSRGAAGAYADCGLKMADGAARLDRSAREVRAMGRAGSRGFALRKSNVLTWVSAALTDQTTCLDELKEAGIRAAVQKKVAEASRTTSWALALVNRIRG